MCILCENFTNEMLVCLWSSRLAIKEQRRWVLTCLLVSLIKVCLPFEAKNQSLCQMPILRPTRDMMFENKENECVFDLGFSAEIKRTIEECLVATFLCFLL